MRRSAIAFSVLGFLVLAYVATGYWLAPRLVRDALVERANAAGVELRIGRVRTNPFALTVVLENVEAVSPDVTVSAPSAAADLAWASLWRRAWIIERARVTNATLRPRGRHLALEALTAELEDFSGARGTYHATARLTGRAAGDLATQGALSVSGDKVTLHDVSVSGTGVDYEGLKLPKVSVQSPEVPIPLEKPLQLVAQASVAPQGNVTARGSLQIAPFALQVELNAERVALGQAQRWLPKDVALRIASGAISGAGRLDVNAKRTTYRGSVAVRDLRLEERPSRRLLLAWQHAETAALRFASSPLEIAAGDVLVRAPEGRLVIGEDGSLNVAALFPAGGDDDSPARTSIGRLQIERGTLHFADRSLASPFEVTLRELSGALTDLGGAGTPARVRLNGRVQPYGSARINGTVDLDAPTKLADIRATLRNLRLEAFNPYVAKFAGYRIESGRLSAQLRYEIRDGRLVGTNRLAFEQMQLGEKLEQRGVLDLPLELAVALLADAKGRINLDIPVRGNLNDPQFDVSAIVARAVGNVLKRIVSAPFRALAALVGGDGDDAQPVAFAPGSAALSPPEEERVAQLAQSLEQRPQLAVEVRGTYDPSRDMEALRLRTARQDVARAARVKGSPDLADAKVVRAAEKLYLQRGGDRGTMRALRKDEARYGRALLQQLAAMTTVEPGAAPALARERAEAVQAGLVQNGVEPARVRVGEPSRKQAGEEGIAVELALTAD